MEGRCWGLVDQRFQAFYLRCLPSPPTPTSVNMCEHVASLGLLQVAELKRQLGQRNFERDCLRGDVDDLKAKVRT